MNLFSTSVRAKLNDDTQALLLMTICFLNNLTDLMLEQTGKSCPKTPSKTKNETPNTNQQNHANKAKHNKAKHKQTLKKAN